jgi:hypothetical protein
LLRLAFAVSGFASLLAFVIAFGGRGICIGRFEAKGSVEVGGRRGGKAGNEERGNGIGHAENEEESGPFSLQYQCTFLPSFC